jgi:hypothetical protein
MYLLALAHYQRVAVFQSHFKLFARLYHGSRLSLQYVYLSSHLQRRLPDRSQSIVGGGGFLKPISGLSEILAY